MNVLKRYIAKSIEKCLNCQLVKDQPHKPSGLTQNIAIPTWKWEDVNMDFVVGLNHMRR